jgi:hypothetical protein
LAWICVNGVAAASAADFEFVAAPSTAGAPIDDTKKSKLTVIAEIEVLETFVIDALRHEATYLDLAPSRVQEILAR